MIFESLNIYLFDCINSFATQNAIVDRVAIFTAHDLNTVFICFLLFLLVYQWKIYNYLFAKTLLIVLLSLILSDLAEIFYHHPRPFEIGLGHQLIGAWSKFIISQSAYLNHCDHCFFILVSRF